jgi:hypothetical protein
VRDQVSHLYSTTGKITVLYILIFRFFIWDGKTKDFGLNDSKHSLNLISSWFQHERHSDLLASSPSIWILPSLQRFVSCPYILVLSWVRMTRHNHTLYLLCICF